MHTSSIYVLAFFCCLCPVVDSLYVSVIVFFVFSLLCLFVVVSGFCSRCWLVDEFPFPCLTGDAVALLDRRRCEMRHELPSVPGSVPVATTRIQKV